MMKMKRSRFLSAEQTAAGFLYRPGRNIQPRKGNDVMGNKYDEADEEMTVELELDDGTNVTCAIITILEVEGHDYIVLMPLDENGENTDGEVWFYRYSENPDDPNEEPELGYIDDDAEYEKVEEAFDEYLDSCEFDELIDADDSDN